MIGWKSGLRSVTRSAHEQRLLKRVLVQQNFCSTFSRSNSPRIGTPHPPHMGCTPLLSMYTRARISAVIGSLCP